MQVNNVASLVYKNAQLVKAQSTYLQTCDRLQPRQKALANSPERICESPLHKAYQVKAVRVTTRL